MAHIQKLTKYSVPLMISAKNLIKHCEAEVYARETAIEEEIVRLTTSCQVLRLTKVGRE